jgi:hypothetical protein
VKREDLGENRRLIAKILGGGIACLNRLVVHGS